jgi:pimeloyl-ACP methyl ester carboxylesterase
MTMTQWTEGDVDHNDINIHYYRTGRGELPALVLAHGFSDNGLCWTRVVKGLEAYFDIVMVDARNHGKSSRGPASLGAMTDDLYSVITTLNLNRPVVLGHSMGASMAADLAARHPKVVSKLLLEDPPWTKHQGVNREGDAEKRSAGFRHYLSSLEVMTEVQIIDFGKKLNPTWHDDDMPAWAASKKQVSAEAMDGLSMGKWSDTVAQIQCPTLLIYADGASNSNSNGNNDAIVTHDIADQVAAVNGCIKVKHIKNAGHNTRREQFEAYLFAVTEFLLP